MSMIKQIFIDSFNGLSADQIPLFLFQLLTAGLLGHLIQKLFNRKWSEDIIHYGALIAVGVALLASLVKYSVSFSILAAALLLLLGRSSELSFKQLLTLFFVAVVGLGCGVGSVVQTLIGAVLVSVITLFIPLKR